MAKLSRRFVASNSASSSSLSSSSSSNNANQIAHSGQKSATQQSSPFRSHTQTYSDGTSTASTETRTGEISNVPNPLREDTNQFTTFALHKENYYGSSSNFNGHTATATRPNRCQPLILRNIPFL